MIQLTPDQYGLAAAKLQTVNINTLFARSVVERHVEGKIYVDSLSDPSAFYVLHPYGMSLLYGSVSDEFLHSRLTDYLLGRGGLREAGESLQVFPTGLENRIDAVLGKKLCFNGSEKFQSNSDYAAVKYTRINFTFNPDTFEQLLVTINLSAYILQEVDASLYNETNGSVVPNQFWNNADDFIRSGIGFSLTHKDQTASIAFSSFVHDHMLELGMETMKEFRHRGFATIVSAKLIEYCLQRGLEPVWSCRQGNDGSYNLARKLGFEPVAYLPYYELLENTVE